MMKDLKKEIGKKIKSTRLDRKSTQADICDDETELTIRQLARIENGQAMPTVPKLIYLAKKLNVEVQYFVDIDKIEIPKDYLRLKKELVDSPTYADRERIERKQAILEEIGECYYDLLPEDEQLLIDVIQARLDIYNSSDVRYGFALLEEYFQQILKKTIYTVNDLLIIELYFFCCAVGLEDKRYFQELADKVMLDIDYRDKEYLTQLEKILLVLLAQLEEKYTLKYIQTFEDVIDKTRHVYYKPIIYMFKAKYMLHVEKNKEKSEEFYGKAITFAELLDDEVLVQRLLEEKKNDF